MKQSQTNRKLWHGISEPPRGDGFSDEVRGKQIKNPAVIRKLAIEAAKTASEHHTSFRCPGCETLFLTEYGRLSRTQWPSEYEIWCLDCIRELRLEVLKTGGHQHR